MSCTIAFAGTTLELHADGTAWFPEHGILCASDIHFEKGSFFQRFATLLPPYDTRVTLGKLHEAMQRFKPRMFVSLGDAFHDAAALERMQPADRAQLTELIEAVPQWVWVEGNHDPRMDGLIGGTHTAEFSAHGITFRHIALPGHTEWELSGHYHPKARVSLSGHGMRLPCFVQSGNRLLLPAFGSYTGGLDVTSEAVTAIMPPAKRSLFLLHRDQVIAWRE